MMAQQSPFMHQELVAGALIKSVQVLAMLFSLTSEAIDITEETIVMSHLIIDICSFAKGSLFDI